MKFAHVVMSRSCIFILVTHLVTLFDFQISACIFVKRPTKVERWYNILRTLSSPKPSYNQRRTFQKRFLLAGRAALYEGKRICEAERKRRERKAKTNGPPADSMTLTCSTCNRQVTAVKVNGPSMLVSHQRTHSRNNDDLFQ